MSEQFTPWRPAGLSSGRLYCKAVRDDDDGLSLVMTDDSGNQLEIIFPGYAAYRNVNESFRLRTWRVVKPPRDWSAFTVQHSDWISWLQQEADGVLDGRPIVHYAIYTDEDCIDVAAESLPIVRTSRTS